MFMELLAGWMKKWMRVNILNGRILGSVTESKVSFLVSFSLSSDMRYQTEWAPAQMSSPTRECGLWCSIRVTSKSRDHVYARWSDDHAVGNTELWLVVKLSGRRASLRLFYSLLWRTANIQPEAPVPAQPSMQPSSPLS